MNNKKTQTPTLHRAGTALSLSALTLAILSAFALGSQAYAVPGPTPINDGQNTISTDITGIAGDDGDDGEDGSDGATGTAGSTASPAVLEIVA